MGDIEWSLGIGDPWRDIISFVVGSTWKEAVVMLFHVYGFGSSRYSGSTGSLLASGPRRELLAGSVVLVWGSDELVVGSHSSVKSTGRTCFSFRGAVFVFVR